MIIGAKCNVLFCPCGFGVAFAWFLFFGGGAGARGGALFAAGLQSDVTDS